MDSIFHSFVRLSSSSSSSVVRPSSHHHHRGAGDDDDNNGSVIGAGGPSRIATLIPREAHRPPPPSPYSNNNEEDAGGVCNNDDREECIQVYRRDGVSGMVELLNPQDDYDLVYTNDDDKNGGGDNSNNSGGGGDEAEGGVQKMDVEGEDFGEEDDDDDNGDTLYIISRSEPRLSLSSSRIVHETDTVTSSDSETSSLIDHNNNTQMLYQHPNTNNRHSKTQMAIDAASIVARALASRTTMPFDTTTTNVSSKNSATTLSLLRPGHRMLLEDEERERKMLVAKKIKEQGKNKNYKDNVVSTDCYDAESCSIRRNHELIASISHSSNIIDGDTTKSLLQLSKLARYQENSIEPRLSCIELDNWEDQIDWEGVADDSDDDDIDGAADGDDGVTTMNKGSRDVVGETCTADYFRAPSPRTTRAKRSRRTLPTEYYNDINDPMILLSEPRNIRLDALDLESAIDWEGACSDDDDDDTSINVPLILHSSVAGRSMATLLACDPTNRPLPFESHASYQQRYEREMMSSETPSTPADISKLGFGYGGNVALEKYKEARQRKREQAAKDKQSRVTEVMSSLSLTGTGRRITSSLMGPGGAERTGRPSRHALGSTAVHDAEYVEQLELVYNHSMVKPILSLSEMRQFHRPRLPLLVVNPTCPWQFQARIVVEKSKRGGGMGGNSMRGSGIASDGSTIVGSYHAMLSAGAKGQSKIRTENDLSPTIGDLVVLEYCEERPPLMLTKGMTCRIVNYYRGDRSRCPVSAGGGDRPLRKRHGDKAASAAKGSAASIGPSNRAERPPRLIGPNQYTIKSAADLIGITGSAEKKKSKEAAAIEAKKAKENAIDVLPEGVTEIIHPKVHGPFIGEVEEGKTQSGLISNLFAAPIFRHESKSTDFLMILGQLQDGRFGGPSSTGNYTSGGLGVVLRPFPQNIYCVGQTEPRVKVFGPNSNDEKKFVNAFVPYQQARNIQRAQERPSGLGLTFDDIKDRLFANSNIPPGQLRLRLKTVANFERSKNGIWSLKALGEDDFPGVEALGRKVSPEGVAAYESQSAAIRRLQDLGIKELYMGGNTILNVAAAMLHLNCAVTASMERRLKMKKVLEIKTRQKSPRLIYFEKAFEKLDSEYREVKKRQEIAKFIYEELQLTPWNITGDFIDVHKRSLGGAMMKLTGFGDPSGCGEAFNFLREADTRVGRSTSVGAGDVSLNAQIKKITGTQNDLRKLTMKQMASLLRSYGMKDKQIAALKRWDRVHVIRDLSTKATSDGMGDELERFARGEKIRLSDQRQNYTQRIQEIWRRQVAALTADVGQEVAARSDLILGSTEEMDVDGVSDAEKISGSNNDSDSSDDDDFFAEMEMEMATTGETNRLVSGLRDNGGGALDSQEMNKDAREFAALQRSREEERNISEGVDKKSSAHGVERPKFKVVRRKITRASTMFSIIAFFKQISRCFFVITKLIKIQTRPDGTQTVTFEFIVNRDNVDAIVARMKQQSEGDDKKRNERKKKKKTESDNVDHGERCVGQATFEDEDNVKTRRSLKLKIKKETRVVQRKMPGPKKASHFQITSSIKHSRDQAKENRKLKRLKQEEEADLYKSHVRGKGTSNRKERGSARERMPHVLLAERFESVRRLVEGRPNVGAFLKPVPFELFPQYYEIIHEPIDLTAIREKNARYGYNTANDFVADFELMKNNAIKFNGKGTPLANEAIEIFEFVKNTVAQNRQEFNEMEEAVVDQKNGKKKKGMGKTDLGSKSAPMNTANVVLDGVETRVNLGTNLSFGLDDDSDSDNSN